MRWKEQMSEKLSNDARLATVQDEREDTHVRQDTEA